MTSTDRQSDALQQTGQSSESRGAQVGLGRIVFTALMIAVFVAALIAALTFPARAMYLPAVTAGLGAVLAVTVLAGDVVAAIRRGLDHSDRAAVLRTFRYLAWIAGYLVLMLLTGLMAATGIFLAAFLLIEARLRWWLVGIVVVAALSAVYGLSFVLALDWPTPIFL